MSTPNEPTQAAIDATSLSIIRLAKNKKDKSQGELRAAYTTGELRGLNTDAGKEAIKLFDQGNEAIDAFFTKMGKVRDYLMLLGKDLSPAQYEMFGEKRGPAPETERATIQGRAAGFDLDPEMSEHKQPFDPGSPQGQAWLTAFRQARSERDAVMAMAPPAEHANQSGDEGDE